MRAFRWLFITGGVVVVVLVLAIAVGSLWLNSFIHSVAFRQEIESRASTTLGSPVTISRIDFHLLRGIELSGVATQIEGSRLNGEGILTANVVSVNCTYSISALLHHELKLTGVILEKPQIVLTLESVKAVAPLAATAVATTAPSAPVGSPAPFDFILEGAKLKDGSFSIRDGSGVPSANLQGVAAQADTSGYYVGKDVTGQVQVADMVLPGGFHLTDFSTPFTYRGGTLSAKTMAAAAFGGRLAGDYELNPVGPSVLEVNARGLDMAQVGVATDPTSRAKLSGSLDVQSKWIGVETHAASGEGDAQLTHGKLEGVRVLQDLAEILRVKELAAPDLTQVQTHFQIAGGQTRFTGLQLDAGAFRMTGAGVIGAGGSLDANMVLILTRDSMARIPKQASLFFVQQPDGSGSIAYHLSGTVDHPQTDLATRIFIQNMQMQNVISKALDRFFHKRKKAPAAPVPASSPDQTPDGGVAPVDPGSGP